MKKIIFLVVKKHSGEIDWILPILNEAKKNFYIVTIFNNPAAFESLKQNKDLFLLWKQINKSYIIENKFDYLFYKIFYKFFLKLKINNFSNFFLDKIHNPEKILKKLNLTSKKIDIGFLAYNNFSYWPISLQKNYESKIVRFPEAQHIWNYNSKYNSFKKNIYNKLATDIILLSKNENFFKKSYLKNKKLIFCGFPKYNLNWLKKFKVKKKPQVTTNKKTILIATRPPFKGKGQIEYFSQNSYEYIICSIIKLAKKIKNIKLIFKLHPNTEDKIRLVKFCKLFSFNNYSFRSSHLYKLAQQSDICISMYSSAVLDCLAAKKPVIEFWLNNIDNIDFIKDKKNDWISIYTKLDLVEPVNNYNLLEKKIK